MKKNMIIMEFLAIMVIWLFFGCDYFFDIKGNGKIVTQTRTATEFTSVIANGALDVNIYPGEDFKVEISTDNNIVDYIKTDVSSNTLRIEYKNTYIPTELTIDIYMPDLEYISLNGSGSITVETGSAQELEINLYGSGTIDTESFETQDTNFNLNGSGTIKTRATNTLTGTITSSGTVEALSCAVKNANVNIYGSGIIKIWVTDTLEGSVSGSGVIYYKGEPEVNVKNPVGTGGAEPLE